MIIRSVCVCTSSQGLIMTGWGGSPAERWGVRGLRAMGVEGGRGKRIRGGRVEVDGIGYLDVLKRIRGMEIEGLKQRRISKNVEVKGGGRGREEVVGGREGGKVEEERGVGGRWWGREGGCCRLWDERQDNALPGLDSTYRIFSPWVVRCRCIHSGSTPVAQHSGLPSVCGPPPCLPVVCGPLACLAEVCGSQPHLAWASCAAHHPA